METKEIVKIAIPIIMYLIFSFLQFRMAKKSYHEYPWFAFVPILQVIQFLQIANVSLWWIIGLFIPVINLVIILWLCIKVSYHLGEKKGFGLLLLLPPVSIWALWKLGNRDKNLDSVSKDAQFFINKIRLDIASNFSEDLLRPHIITKNITTQEAQWLINKAENPHKQTKTWAIIILFILELPLFLAKILLILFFISSEISSFILIENGNLNINASLNKVMQMYETQGNTKTDLTTSRDTILQRH